MGLKRIAMLVQKFDMDGAPLRHNQQFWTRDDD